MSNDTPASGNSGCTCGGCGIGTTCAFTDTAMKTGSFDGTYVYAAPEVKPRGILPDTPDGTGTKPQIYTTIPDQYRATLQDEMVKDLLERVQKLETEVASLREDNLDLLGSLAAISDIMEDEAAKGPRSIVDVLLGNR